MLNALFGRKEPTLPTAESALPGRDTPMAGLSAHHHVHGHPLTGPWDPPLELAFFGLGCFWGAERRFWQTAGVFSTAVGYQGGFTPNPTYREVCSGRTGHNEVVQVVFDPGVVSYEALVRVFLESHDPTQGMGQGNDRGTQYRSGIYGTAAQVAAAALMVAAYGAELAKAGLGSVTTEVLRAPPFYYAEDNHQQYLAKNPGGYCGLGGTGVSCPVGVVKIDESV